MSSGKRIVYGDFAIYVAGVISKKKLNKLRDLVKRGTKISFKDTLVPRIKLLSTNKKKPIKEWALKQEVRVSSGGVFTCLCNEADLKTAYVLQNTKNGNEIYVGSECIKNFNDKETNQELLEMQKLIEHTRKRFQNKDKGYILPLPKDTYLRDRMGSKTVEKVKKLIRFMDVKTKRLDGLGRSYRYVNFKKAPAKLKKILRKMIGINIPNNVHPIEHDL